MAIKHIIAVCLAIILMGVPLRGGRQTNGSTDYLQGLTPADGLFTNNLGTQAQGTVSFYLYLISFPAPVAGTQCGLGCGEIINIVGTHTVVSSGNDSCRTVFGACLDIFVCPTGSLGCGSNSIVVDITTPNQGEAETVWPMQTGGPHLYTFLLNRTATNMQMYKDGTLVTISASGQNGDPGPINYTAGVIVQSPVTFMAATGLNHIDSFANGILSDVAIWDLTLTTAEIQRLATCTPPNRIHPEDVVYWPLYGVDSPEPNYSSQIHGSFPSMHINSTPVTPHGTTGSIQQVGCQPGGAYH